MDKDTRTQIQRATQNARSLLEREYAEQLEGTFDIRPDGTIAAAPGDHLDAEQRLIRQKLVAAINHHRPHVTTNGEAVDAYLREAAFTMLNRFVALKMLEARDLVQQCISQGEQSSGFKEFTGLAPGLVQLPDKGYRLYIECLFDEIAREVQVLFDRRDPASLLWPRRQALTDLLAILNASELAGVWGEDETIGWVYQYFNSDEERKQMRAESQAPRNSRELAVRNQFFTPRYVVEFLTDNTLGRIWYEMRQGNTHLVEECDYLVRRTSEVFLGQGEEAPAEEDAEADLSQEELLKKTVYIPFRGKKDPRDLKILDPACGSGHFLLYTFDLLLTIYEEGWADEEATVSEVTGQSLRQDYSTLEELRAAVPGLILRYNLYGIDIDPRAAQIASLALWMKAQRAYNDLGIARRQRQPIRKTNVVLAEPMPGDADQLEEFAASLDKQLGQLIRKVFKKMELAGEAGSLLKIEEEIQSAVREIYPEFSGMYQAQDEQRWLAAEGALLTALQAYAEQAQNGQAGQAYQRRLFAEDAARGFAFIDICQQHYDALLMNPPFGAITNDLYDWLSSQYLGAHNDVFAAFVRRGRVLCSSKGRLGAITSRSFLLTRRLESYRRIDILPRLDLLVDLGSSVMDSAFVESAAFVTQDKQKDSIRFTDLRKHELDDKSQGLLKAILKDEFIHKLSSSFSSLPQSKILYGLPKEVYRLLQKNILFEPNGGTAREGMKTFDNFRFLRLFWEVPIDRIGMSKKWVWLAKGGEYSFYYSDFHLVVNWNIHGHELQAVNSKINNSTSQVRQASDFWFQSGATYSRRSARGFSARILPKGFIFTDKGPAVIPNKNVSNAHILGWLNSKPIRALIHLQANASDFLTGIIKQMPWKEIEDGELRNLEIETSSALKSMIYKSAIKETSPYFSGPISGRIEDVLYKRREFYEDALNRLDSITSRWDEKIQNLYGLPRLDWADEILNNDLTDVEESEINEDEDRDVENIGEIVFSAISFGIGLDLGRWKAEASYSEEFLDDPFDFLPSASPILDPEAGQGILADDPGSNRDVTSGILKRIATIHLSSEEEIRDLVFSCFGCSLREYVCAFGANGFWSKHIEEYSRSRRKAPIYWQLATPSASYSVWLYYHRFTKDTFYKVLNDYVKPKLDHEERNLIGLTQEAGPNPSASQRKEIAAQEAFITELRAFRDEIAIIAPLWNPNLSDGVIINFAPLWRLVPHHRSWQKECKDCWDKLVKGDYDWAHLAIHLWPERVVPKCQTDRSLAIAHGLEEVFWEADDATGKWKPRQVSKETIAHLIQERSSPAVKDALKSLLEAPAASGSTQTRSRRKKS